MQVRWLVGRMAGRREARGAEDEEAERPASSQGGGQAMPRFGAADSVQFLVRGVRARRRRKTDRALSWQVRRSAYCVA